MYPNFNGEWSGSEVLTACTDSGFWEGVCKEYKIGERHDSDFTQTDATVEAMIDAGGGLVFEATGTISISGLLTLPPTPGTIPDTPLIAEVQNWRTRSDTPAKMTGRYEVRFTAPGGGAAISTSLFAWRMS